MSLNSICEEILNTTKEAYINGSNNAVEAFKKAWAEAYQDGGKRTDYLNAYKGSYWNDSTFIANYPIKANPNNNNIFQNSNITHIDVPIEFDCFVRNEMGEFESSVSYTFAECRKLETIEEIKIIADYPTSQKCYNNIFRNCTSLKNINKISGVIHGDGLSFIHSPNLTSITMQKILLALEQGNYSSTITFTNDQWNKLNSEIPLPEDIIFMGIYTWQEFAYSKGFNY